MFKSKILSLGVVLALLLVGSGLAVSASFWSGSPSGTLAFQVGSLDFYVNGEKQTLDMVPYIKEGRVFIEIRNPAVALGIPADCLNWNNEQKSLRGSLEGNTVKMTVNSRICWLNEVPFLMNETPELVEGRVTIPLRWAAEALGADIEWDNALQTIKLQY